ncbi:hypothetical protein AXE65_01250 [Ventosimonas gracilis]|uniref:Uncharacterized protein n=1 Tax=Ventosimonas gracilis TaxID=1680762 RepID=A0A139SV91_9GAMM|nr:hypothetical protein [Ventosimonas gracilis]KXU38370.1 hypothetical protein AXE65_01250 [Ventosimonas gracilis]
MVDNVENLTLEHLKCFQEGQERIEHRLVELTQRIGRIEQTLARSNAIHEESYAEQSARLDHLNDRIERIERRLELRDH